MPLTLQRRLSSLLAPVRNGRRPGTRRRRLQSEVLEDRALLDITFPTIVATEIGQGKDLYIPLTAVDDDGSEIEFVVNTNNPNVETEVLTGGRSLRFNVTVGDVGDGTSFTGDMTFRLFEDLAPITTGRIIELVEDGFYDIDNDIIFHRVIDDFVAQFGDPTGTGAGGSGFEFPDEFDPSLTFSSPGLLAMANSGPDTNDSQLFIVDTDISLFSNPPLPQSLNFDHTILGILTSGRDTLTSIIQTPTAADRPLADVTLNSVEVFEDDQNGVLRIRSDELGSSTIDVTANSATTTQPASQNFVVTVVADTFQDEPYFDIIDRSVDTANNSITYTVTGIDLDDDDLDFDLTSAVAGVTVSVDTDNSPLTGATSTITVTADSTYVGTPVTLGVGEIANAGTTVFDDTEVLSLLPTADDQTIDTESGNATLISLSADDGDILFDEDLEFILGVQPSNGVITGFDAANGQLTYTPNAGFTGTDNFSFTASDNFLGSTVNRQSNPATVTINVSDVSAPQDINLAAESDNGVSSIDNFTSAEEWVVTLTADPGADVDVLVNSAVLQATETTIPGSYTVTIPLEDLVVGDNSISAESTVDGNTTTAVSPLNVVFAPEIGDTYYVPGTIGDSVDLSFEWVSENAAFANEIGFYIADDADGRVDGILPGQDGYAAAALSSDSRQVVFEKGVGVGQTSLNTTVAGERVGFYLVSNASTQQFLQMNSGNNGRYEFLNAFFSFDAANPDGEQHIRTVVDRVAGNMVLQFEDMLGDGDGDFNDAVITVQSLDNPTVDAGESIRLPGGDTHVNEVEFELVPTRQANGTAGPQVLQGELGIFPVDDTDGTVNGASPGDADYLDEVNTVAQTVFANGRVVTLASETIDLNGGAYGFYYAPGSTLANVEADNPTNDSDNGNVVLFSFDTGNPGDTEHFRWFTPEARAERVRDADAALELDLHFTDELFASDAFFDDYQLSIKVD